MKSRTLYLSFLPVLLILHCSFGFAQNEAETPPELPDDLKEMIQSKQVLEGLAKSPPHVQRMIREQLTEFPGSLPHERIIFFRGINDVTKKQQGLVAALFEHPDFFRDLEEVRGPLFDLEIETALPYEISGVAKVRNDEISDWGKKLFEMVNRFAPGQAAQAQLDVLKEKIGKGFLRGSFRLFGHIPLRAKENPQNLRNWLSAYILLERFSSRNRAGQVTQWTWQGISEGTLDYFEEKETFLPAIKKIALQMKATHRDAFLAWATKEVGEIHNWAKGEFIETNTNTDHLATVGRTLRVREVHPDISVLRGFVGNDCATAVSYGFPYSPYERVYYVIDVKKDESGRVVEENVLGYASGSIVRVGGVKTMFFHTIAGPKFTSEQSDLVMRGIHAVRETLGFKQMVLPSDGRISDNINYSPIDQAMKGSVRGQKVLEVEWLDRDYREIIYKHGSSPFYDSPDRNQEGRLLVMDESAVRVEVTSRPFKPINWELFSPWSEPPAQSAKLGCRGMF